MRQQSKGSGHKRGTARPGAPAAAASERRRRSPLGVIVGLIVVGVVVGLWVLGRSDAGEAAKAAGAGTDELASTPYASSATVQYVGMLNEIPPGKPDHVELVYFHRTVRCSSCKTAERLTRRTVETHFAGQVASGAISLAVIDVQTGGQTEVVREYGAYGPSLFIGVFKGGVHYIFHASDTYVALNSEPTFMSILKADVAYALGLG